MNRWASWLSSNIEMWEQKLALQLAHNLEIPVYNLYSSKAFFEKTLEIQLWDFLFHVVKFFQCIPVPNENILQVCRFRFHRARWTEMSLFVAASRVSRDPTLWNVVARPASARTFLTLHPAVAMALCPTCARLPCKCSRSLQPPMVA